MEEPKRNIGYGTLHPHTLSAQREDPDLGKTWMSRIDDSTLLSALTIPGTHDSAAYTYPVPFIQTQTLDINHQLEHGIRYFDLRCGLRNDELEMVHGPTLLHITLRSVLDAFLAFLQANPSEALIIQLKKDRSTETSRIRFSTAIHSLLSAYPVFTTPATPILSQIRGKILLFRRFANPLPIGPYGIDVTPWPDNPPDPFTIITPSSSSSSSPSHPSGSPIQLTVQDHYLFTDLPLPALLRAKAHATTHLFALARTNPDPTHWYVNFASASEVSLWYRYSPRDVAVGGYARWRWEAGVNGRVRDWVGEHCGRRRLGIVVLDFVGEGGGGEGLVGMLIRSNELRGDAKGGGCVLVGIGILVAVGLGVVCVVLVNGMCLESWEI